ncbi:flavin-dependent monooxygenase [Streptomyces sp. NPDC059832]|uniref:flavin-dependent monooxygenase n=1 Tax=Streptomyces sp. NPDC059832 TaxID=3346966 RepID=UPI0036474F52
MCTGPRRFGGEPLPPADFIRIVERVSRVDGSTGWVVAFASALTYLAALPLDTQAQIYKDGPNVVFAGGLFPIQPALRTERGYLVDGRWKFASGCMAADLIGVGIPADDGSGRPRTALPRPEQVEIMREWDVTGMRGSGSYDILVDGVEVDRDWTFGHRPSTSLSTATPSSACKLRSMRRSASASPARPWNSWSKPAAEQVSPALPPLAERAHYRTTFAKAYASLHSAQAFYLDTAEEVWQTVLAGDEPSPRQVAIVRLSSANVADVAAQVVHDLCAISGAGVIHNSHPLQLLQQDAQVPRLHATLGQAMTAPDPCSWAGPPPTPASPDREPPRPSRSPP